MKKDRKSRNRNIELYNKLETSFCYEDTRYYGLFYGKVKGKEVIQIDPKRFSQYTSLRQDIKDVISKRKSHYFIPKKINYYDYNCNIFEYRLNEIKKDWENDYKPIIDKAVKDIQSEKKLTPGDYGNFQNGISGYGSANAWAIWNNMINENNTAHKKHKLLMSMYAQFFHLMASQIEAVSVFVITKNGFKSERFDRTSFYNFKNVGQEKIEKIDGFESYDKMYCIWNFCKHNSSSTYKTLKDRYPEILFDGEYKQGELSVGWLKLSEKLIVELVDGLTVFFNNYCDLVFKEKTNESKWNYNKYFENIVDDKIEDYRNPLGLNWYDEID